MNLPRKLAVVIVILLSPVGAVAEPIVQLAQCVDSSNQCATGITGLRVRDMVFDVDFRPGSFNSVYGTDDPFFLGNVSGARSAAEAITAVLDGIVFGVVGEGFILTNSSLFFVIDTLNPEIVMGVPRVRVAGWIGFTTRGSSDWAEISENQRLGPGNSFTDVDHTASLPNQVKHFAVFDLDETQPPTSVTIDIKPGKTPNSINPSSKQKIPVAILTTASFDALDVFYALEADPLSVEFGPDAATESHGRWHVKDVDEDGDMDLLFHFNTQETGIVCGDTAATLTGETSGGEPITGTDSINTVPCR